MAFAKKKSNTCRDIFIGGISQMFILGFKVHCCFFFLLMFAAVPSLATNLSNKPESPEGQLTTSLTHGLSFMVPKGRRGLRMELRALGYDEYFDNKGNKLLLGNTLDGVDLNAQIFPAMQIFGADATLGKTLLSTEVDARRIEISLGYGITDDLTVGVIIPYGEVDTRTNFSVSGGNIGINPIFDATQAIAPNNFPFAPAGGSIPSVNTAEVQSVLTNPAFGLGYKPIKNTRWSVLSDPSIGLLWRFHKTSSSQWILGAGLRIGITDENDPDDLLDVQIDDGSTDIRTRLEYYRDLGHGFDLKVQLEHDFQLEDSITARVPLPGQLLAPLSSKENLDRNLGDYTEYDIGLGKTLGNWRIGAAWHRYEKNHDSYHSRIGTDTAALEANTDIFINQWQATLSWSGLDAWKSGKVPMPMVVQLNIQDTYRAKNFPDLKDISLQLTGFF